MVTGLALVFGVDMEHLAWLDGLYRLPERFGHRFVVFPAVAGGMQNGVASRNGILSTLTTGPQG
jgi:hypothetical protein